MPSMLALNSRFFQPQLTSVLGISRKHHCIWPHVSIFCSERSEGISCPSGQVTCFIFGSFRSCSSHLVLDHRSRGHFGCLLTRNDILPLSSWECCHDYPWATLLREHLPERHSRTNQHPVADSMGGEGAAPLPQLVPTLRGPASSSMTTIGQLKVLQVLHYSPTSLCVGLVSPVMFYTHPADNQSSLCFVNG